MPAVRRPRDPSLMETKSLPFLKAMPAGAMRTLLTQERDPHRRQRELVRASLLACPGKGRSPRHLAY